MYDLFGTNDFTAPIPREVLLHASNFHVSPWKIKRREEHIVPLAYSVISPIVIATTANSSIGKWELRRF